MNSPNYSWVRKVRLGSSAVQKHIEMKVPKSILRLMVLIPVFSRNKWFKVYSRFIIRKIKVWDPEPDLGLNSPISDVFKWKVAIESDNTLLKKTYDFFS